MILWIRLYLVFLSLFRLQHFSFCFSSHCTYIAIARILPIVFYSSILFSMYIYLHLLCIYSVCHLQLQSCMSYVFALYLVLPFHNMCLIEFLIVFIMRFYFFACSMPALAYLATLTFPHKQKQLFLLSYVLRSSFKLNHLFRTKKRVIYGINVCMHCLKKSKKKSL